MAASRPARLAATKMCNGKTGGAIREPDKLEMSVIEKALYHELATWRVS